MEEGEGEEGRALDVRLSLGSRPSKQSEVLLWRNRPLTAICNFRQWVTDDNDQEHSEIVISHVAPSSSSKRRTRPSGGKSSLLHRGLTLGPNQTC